MSKIKKRGYCGAGGRYHFAEKLRRHEDLDTHNRANNSRQDSSALKLVALRKDGKVEIGGAHIDDLISEVGVGLRRPEWMLVLFKNELFAAVMEAEAAGFSERKTAPLAPNASSVA
jgi:hypothetical protein